MSNRIVFVTAVISYAIPSCYSFLFLPPAVCDYNPSHTLSIEVCNVCYRAKIRTYQQLSASSNNDEVEVNTEKSDRGGIIIKEKLFGATGDYLAEAFASLKDDDKVS